MAVFEWIDLVISDRDGCQWQFADRRLPVRVRHARLQPGVRPGRRHRGRDRPEDRRNENRIAEPHGFHVRVLLHGADDQHRQADVRPLSMHFVA